MSLTALVTELTPVNVRLDQIYLDPNNPRFIGYEWEYIPDDEIDNQTVQEATRRKLVSYFGVRKLRMNMEVNGYLPIDRIIVRNFGKDRFVVLEGNRRVCAAKLITDLSMDGSTISDEVLTSLEMIPCLQYIGDDSKAAWIFQGLRHIIGINDWSAFNKAKLLVEQMEEEGLTMSQVGRRFGLTSHGAGQWVRGYYAFKQANEASDYIDEVDERSYPYFQELFSRSSAKVREWMDWDEKARKFNNVLNLNEFVGWLYPRKENEEETNTGGSGDWEKRILKRRDDIRQVAYLLQEDQEIFEKFRHERDIEKAYAEAISKKYEKAARESHDPGEEVFRALQECTKALEDIPYRLVKNPDSHNRLMTAIGKLEQAIATLRD